MKLGLIIYIGNAVTLFEDPTFLKLTFFDIYSLLSTSARVLVLKWSLNLYYSNISSRRSRKGIFPSCLRKKKTGNGCNFVGEANKHAESHATLFLSRYTKPFDLFSSPLFNTPSAIICLSQKSTTILLALKHRARFVNRFLFCSQP